MATVQPSCAERSRRRPRESPRRILLSTRARGEIMPHEVGSSLPPANRDSTPTLWTRSSWERSLAPHPSMEVPHQDRQAARV